MQKRKPADLQWSVTNQQNVLFAISALFSLVDRWTNGSSTLLPFQFGEAEIVFYPEVKASSMGVTHQIEEIVNCDYCSIEENSQFKDDKEINLFLDSCFKRVAIRSLCNILCL